MEEEMKKNVINKKIVTVIFCCWISLFARPSHAFVWPTIDPVQITQFITSITKNISKATSFVSGITTTVQQINVMITANCFLFFSIPTPFIIERHPFHQVNPHV